MPCFAIGTVTRQIEELVVRMFGLKATAVLTNVRGPADVPYIAGQPISGLTYWVPQSGRLGLGASILGYVDKLLVGVAVDAGLLPDPEALRDAINAELDAYLALVRQARDVGRAAGLAVNT